MARKVRGIRDKCPPGYIVGRRADSTGDAAPEFIPMSEITGASGSGGPTYTDERAQDAVGSILVDTATIDFTYNDAVPSITADFIGTAADVDYVPHDHVTSTNVQSAMNEIIDEFVSKVRTTQEVMVATELLLQPAPGTAGTLRIETEGNVGCNLTVDNYRAASFSGRINMQKARGTRASPSVIVANDDSFLFIGRAYDGAVFRDAFRMRGTVIAATPSPTSFTSQTTFELVPTAGGATTNALTLDFSSGLQLFGSNVVVDASRHFRLRSYTTATLPSASPANQYAIVSDDAIIGVVPIYSDGTNWRRVVDHQIVGAATRLLPAGGSTNYVLRKASGTDYDVTWGAAPSGTGFVTQDVQEFTGNGTWTKPSGISTNAMVDVIVIGAGGGGAGGQGAATSTARGGGCGGGGGGHNRAQFRATELAATVTVTIGTGGTAGTGGSTANGTDGGDGGSTTFGTHLFGGGGGGGRRGTNAAGSGGSGGGSVTAGATGTTSLLAGGQPLISTNTTTLSQVWGGGNTDASVTESQASYYGGGGGGGTATPGTATRGAGGQSRWGGGGGGTGACLTAANNTGAAGAGGGRSGASPPQGGGGAGGAATVAGTAGTAGSGYRGGDGGGGGGENLAGTGAVGGAGGARGGGGGGGGTGTSVGGAGGVGGAGYCLVITYF